jgi:hypothetical protein
MVVEYPKPIGTGLKFYRRDDSTFESIVGLNISREPKRRRAIKRSLKNANYAGCTNAEGPACSTAEEDVRRL